jgi:hypothetical protein
MYENKYAIFTSKKNNKTAKYTLNDANDTV